MKRFKQLQNIAERHIGALQGPTVFNAGAINHLFANSQSGIWPGPENVVIGGSELAGYKQGGQGLSSISVPMR